VDGVVSGVKGAAGKLLGIFDLDSEEKIHEVKVKIIKTMKGAGKQAVSAAIVTLLTALATGAQDAIGDMLKTSKSNVTEQFGHHQQSSLFDEDPYSFDRTPTRTSHYPRQHSNNHYGQQSFSGGNPWDKV
jgi:hypothetical protein